MRKTPFYTCHTKANAKIIEFCNYLLPLNYGSQIREHEIVREDAGMFDVSHMQVTDVMGKDRKRFLRFLLSNDVYKLDQIGIGKALYSVMLNDAAGIVDDLVVYLLDGKYRIVSNAATKEKLLSWIVEKSTDYDVDIDPCSNLAMIAIQGPNAIDKVIRAIPAVTEKLKELKPFNSFNYDEFLFARTGYTGEDGLEIMFKDQYAEEFWQQMLAVKILPCGLGARDTLRLEAGMNLYGHDMDEKTTPSECGLDWVVDTTDESRNFIGKNAYLDLKFRTDASKTQVGVILEGKGVLREGQLILSDGDEVGIITSGTFSPTLKKSIAFARVSCINRSSMVNIRGNLESISFVKLPFVRNGKIISKLLV